MKKLLAIILAVSMVFTLSACGDGNVDADDSTTANEETTTDIVDNSENTDINDEAPSTESTTVSDEKNPEKPVSNSAANWSKTEIVEFYKQSAVKSGSTAKSTQSMSMANLTVTDSGAVGIFVNMIKPVINNVLKSNTVKFNGITGGYTKLVPEDVKSAKAYYEGKYTVIEMTMVEQTDGIYGNMTEGTVGHAISVLGNVSTAVEQFPNFNVDLKNAHIKINYTNPTVKVKINSKGIIEKGTWSYKAKVNIENLKIDSIKIKKAYAEIDYKVITGGGF